MAFKFEKLEIWKLALEMADNIHMLTRSFPKEEIFSLTNQIKRAADSISLNIAEGSTSQSDAEQAKFLSYSQRSVMEVVNCLYLAIRRSYMDQSAFDKLYNELDKLAAKIQAFKNALKRKNS